MVEDYPIILQLKCDPVITSASTNIKMTEDAEPHSIK